MSKSLMLFFLIAVSVSAVAATTQKNLGDINGDGKSEIAVEARQESADTYHTDVKIVSGSNTVLELVGLGGDTADGYRIVGHQIVVWRGDWINTPSKREPHYYDFTWYSWNPKRGKYLQSQEGFTTRAYSYKDATKIMPQLSAKPSRDIIISRGTSFADWAIELATKKFRQRYARAIISPISNPKGGKTFNLVGGAYVGFETSGIIRVGKMDGVEEIIRPRE